MMQPIRESRTARKMNQSGNQVSIFEDPDLIPAGSAVQAQRSRPVDPPELQEHAIEHERS
jgi:hypothetical protein